MSDYTIEVRRTGRWSWYWQFVGPLYGLRNGGNFLPMILADGIARTERAALRRAHRAAGREMAALAWKRDNPTKVVQL